MNVEIINTGSELMLGRVLNTHQQWLCRRLADLGHVVTRQVAIGDTGEEIRQAVRESLSRADLIITTGGLGPTSDDITRELIAGLLGKTLVQNQEVLAHIENFFVKRGRPRPKKTDVETLVPEGALVFLNPTGTAPGLAMSIGDGDLELGSGEPLRKRLSPEPGRQIPSLKWLIMLPGPPRELRPMFDQFVVPLVRREFMDQIFVCRTLLTTGLGESRVQELVEADLEPLVQRGLGVGYCARPGEVDVRLLAGGAQAAPLVSEGEAIVQRILGANVFGFDDEEIEEIVVKQLIARKSTLALAESCTGGALAHRLTNVPGASEIFLGGVVSYANSAKEHLLGVPPASLTEHGAVSEAVAAEMAAGARKKFGADYAIGITGIAGPGGGSAEKPVGTVFIALAAASGVEVKKFVNAWERPTFKQVTATQALDWLRQVISA